MTACWQTDRPTVYYILTLEALSTTKVVFAWYLSFKTKKIQMKNVHEICIMAYILIQIMHK